MLVREEPSKEDLEAKAFPADRAQEDRVLVPADLVDLGGREVQARAVGRGLAREAAQDRAAGVERPARRARVGMQVRVALAERADGLALRREFAGAVRRAPVAARWRWRPG